MSDPRCSQVVADLGEPLAATAPLARAWVVLEQPGPYGHTALLDSHLPPRVGAAFAAGSEGTATTVLLARAAGHHHPDVHRPVRHRIWIAYVSPGAFRMRVGTVADLQELVTADLPEVLERAGRGELPAWGVRSTEPLLLVCGNGRRDLCCALAGRAVSTELAEDPAYGGRVIEVSHLGGHRFAPTALLLPFGMAYGRLDGAAARQVIDMAAAGQVSLDGARGFTALAAPLQAADLALRQAFDLPAPDELAVLRPTPTGKLAPAALHWDGGDGDSVELVGRHADGRSWRIPVHRERSAQPRRESCAKGPRTGTWWVAGAPTELAPWR